MGKFLSGEELRQWAKRCLSQSETSTNDIERHRLLKMHDGLMEMARTQDWLDGQDNRAPAAALGSTPAE